MRDSARPLRVLHCPTDVGGNSTGLARAEKGLGNDSVVAVFDRSPLRYDVDIDLELGRRGRWGGLMHRLGFFARSWSRYDVFHFNFGQSFLPRLGAVGLGATGIDLPLLRAARKRLFMTFQGCDVRLTEHCQRHEVSCCGQDTGTGVCHIDGDRVKRQTVAYARRYCHRLFAVDPTSLHAVPTAEWVPYASVDPRTVRVAERPVGKPITIVHAPTHRTVKGTDHVLRAIEALRRSMDVNCVLVENLPHAEAMRQYEQADLVIDQLKVGWYGGFAVEMMAMGKPVIAYVRDEDLRRVPPKLAEELPVVNATPATIETVLEELARDPDRLADIGRRSRAFVERWHDPVRIARRMLEIYEDPQRSFWGESGELPPAP